MLLRITVTNKEKMKYRDKKPELPTQREINIMASVAFSFISILGIGIVLFLIFITEGVFY